MPNFNYTRSKDNGFYIGGIANEEQRDKNRDYRRIFE